MGERDFILRVGRENHTGAIYEVTLKYFDGPPEKRGLTDQVDFFTALREQLGLRLEPKRRPVQVLVIDHIERPTPD
jgi:uncharacterized protein (TIGR03435 family)